MQKIVHGGMAGLKPQKYGKQDMGKPNWGMPYISLLDGAGHLKRGTSTHCFLIESSTNISDRKCTQAMKDI